MNTEEYVLIMCKLHAMFSVAGQRSKMIHIKPTKAFHLRSNTLHVLQHVIHI